MRFLRFIAIATICAGLIGCAQEDRTTAAAARAPRTGGPFSAAGKISFHPGQPCASQIMFDFRMTGKISAVPLAAAARESRYLTEAANSNRRVRIWGNWQHGREGGCDYVTVTKVEPLSVAVVF